MPAGMQGIGFAFGDALAQLAARKPSEPYDWARTAKVRPPLRIAAAAASPTARLPALLY